LVNGSASGGVMRATGFLLVAVIFVAVALVAYAIIRAVGWEAHDFALVAAAIVASQVGAVVWHRQAPVSAERSVKLGLGAILSVTAVAFTLMFQAVSGWLAYPEVTVPIAAIGCFVFPFAVVGPVWKTLSKGKPPESRDAEPRAAGKGGGR
jgi:hypothetical protein